MLNQIMHTITPIWANQDQIESVWWSLVAHVLNYTSLLCTIYVISHVIAAGFGLVPLW